MKTGEFLDLMKLCLALAGVLTAVLTACTATGSSPVGATAQPPFGDTPRRGVIIRTVDVDELSALRPRPRARYRPHHLARLPADSD